MEKRYPKRVNAHQLEELSERLFISSLPRNWRSYKPGSDYGVDLIVELFEEENATALELLIQLKSTQIAVDSEFVTVRLNTATYNYLWDKLQIVMLVKYVVEDNDAYWLLLKDVPEPNQDQGTFSVRIPKTNQLSSIDWNYVQGYIKGVTEGKLAARRRSGAQDATGHWV